MIRATARLKAGRLASIALLFAGIALANGPEASAWGGWNGGGGGGFHGFSAGGCGGFHGFGGDGFGGGTMDHSYSWELFRAVPVELQFLAAPQWQAGYNTYNANQMAEQQSKYNEANTLQENQEHTEESLHNSTMNTVNNSVGNTDYYGNPYGGCSMAAMEVRVPARPWAPPRSARYVGRRSAR